MTRQQVLDAIDAMIAQQTIDGLDAWDYLLRQQEEAVPHLCKLLYTTTDKHRWNIIKVLSEFNDQRSIPALVDCLMLPNTAIVAAAAQLLTQLGGEQAILGLLEALKRRERNDPQATIWIVRALGVLGDQRALQPLFNILHTTDSNTVRYTSINALAQLGNPRAAQEIVRYLGDDNHHVRTYARRALNELAGDGSTANGA